MNALVPVTIQPDDLEVVQRTGKICSQCREWKPFPDFSRNRSRPDGYAHYCKSCAHVAHERWKNANRETWRAGKRRNYQENIERERARARATRARHPDPLRRKNATYNIEHPDRMRAVNAVNRAIASQAMPPVATQRCSTCGNQAEEYHHHSYAEADWLNVTPLCRSCHRQIHTAMKREAQL